jgi:hypothetical protein
MSMILVLSDQDHYNIEIWLLTPDEMSIMMMVILTDQVKLSCPLTLYPLRWVYTMYTLISHVKIRVLYNYFVLLWMIRIYQILQTVVEMTMWPSVWYIMRRLIKSFNNLIRPFHGCAILIHICPEHHLAWQPSHCTDWPEQTCLGH